MKAHPELTPVLPLLNVSKQHVVKQTSQIQSKVYIKRGVAVVLSAKGVDECAVEGNIKIPLKQ